jgi:selenocysteine-specific elongation factor
VDIQPVVIGTAGHIDHGKSSLVRALTGIDPDRWEEEKERGMTIDLGFARLRTPDGRSLGLVDVPGHERFLRNMVAGATGIDLVALVVAADDGVMPQTREHLEIMDLLGVRHGLLVLNKVDLVDAEMAELAEEELRETVAGTFLEGAEVVRTSATSGEGIDLLRQRLFELADAVEPRSDEGVFRLPVQRVFSVKGFGTVLTGIPVSGRVAVGDTLEVLPGGQRGKVRGLQAYHEPTEQGRAGHSTAVNLTDVDHKQVARGHVLATPGFFRTQKMLGASLRTLASLGRPLSNRTPIRLHVGTAEVLGEVVLLDHEELEPGAEGLVQLRLEEAVVAAPGDRFVLRRASPLETLGGGVVLEESRYRLKRFKRFVIDELERQARSLGSLDALLESLLVRAPERWASLEELALDLKRPRPEVASLLASLAEAGRARELQPGRWIHEEALAVSLDAVREGFSGWFEDNPTRARMDVRDLRARVRLVPALVDRLVDLLAEEGELRREAGGALLPARREVQLEPEVQERRDRVLAALEAGGAQPPSPGELAQALGLPPRQVQEMLRLLVDQDAAVHVGAELFLGGAAHAKVRAAVIENCERNGELSIPELRDAIGTTRKFLIPILEAFDTEGLTQRRGNARVLRGR